MRISSYPAVMTARLIAPQSHHVRAGSLGGKARGYSLVYYCLFVYNILDLRR